MNKKRLPIGISDFKEMITEECYFIDKSLMIKDVVEGAKIILYPRPRRFGKTLNLSMLRYFYDNSEDNRVLFNGLKVEKEESVMKKQGKHPVIYITFKDVKANDYNAAMYLIKELILEEYKKHRYLLKSDILMPEDKVYYNLILGRESKNEVFMPSLKNLSEYLSKYHKANPVILIDEYDMPLQGAFTYRYYEEMVMFFRNLLSGCLKDNIYLEKAVLTGILRVAKESIFSGLNNLRVASLISEKSADKFGFLEKDVEETARYYEIEDKLDEIKSWYNGYNFGGVNIYNPWSILNYVDEKKLRPYWVNTSGNELIKDLLGKSDDSVKKSLNDLIEGIPVRKRVEDNIVYNDIDREEDVLWSFLLMSGYLRYDNLEKIGDFYYADLSIPNEEVKYLYRGEIISRWFAAKNTKHGLEKVLKSLTDGDLEEFVDMFTDFSESCFSYFDVTGEESEKFYHAFVLGMVVTLRDSYEIKSNRESGYGRYDVMLIPKDRGKRGIIFEFKRVNKKRETAETAMANAKKQVIEKNYEAELREAGVVKIVRIAAVFEGKSVEVEVF
jgi:hypothetical protein